MIEMTAENIPTTIVGIGISYIAIKDEDRTSAIVAMNNGLLNNR